MCIAISFAIAATTISVIRWFRHGVQRPRINEVVQMYNMPKATSAQLARGRSRAVYALLGDFGFEFLRLVLR